MSEETPNPPAGIPGTGAGEHEARFQAMVQAFDGHIYICSNDFRIEYMNDRLVQRTGRDGTGELCHKVLHDRDTPCPWCVNDRVFAGETVRWEVQSPKDQRWYYVVNTPLRHADGTISKQAMIQDITERKRAEDSARQAEVKFRRFVDGNVIGVIVAESERITEANDIFLKMVGYSREDLAAGRIRWRDMTPPEHDAKDRDAVADLFEKGICTPFEKEYIRKDGGRVPLLLGAALLEREPFRSIGFVLDLTERRQAEESARQAEQRFRRLVDGNIIGVIVTDEQTVFEANDVYLRMLGYSRDDLAAGRVNWAAMTPPEHAHKDARAIEELLERGIGTPFEKEYQRRDGARVPVLLGTALLQRQPFRVICFVLDLTDRKRAERELQSLNESLEARVAERSEAVERLLKELDHRIRNHLAGLLYLVDAMRQRARSVPAFAEAIESRLWAMASVHDLLAQSTWKAVSMEALVLSLLEATGGLAVHRIHVEVDGPPVVISPDRVMALSLILVEWFSNSCKYGAHTTPEGRLRVSWELVASERGEVVRLRWKESSGPRISGPVKPSLGTELVQSFAMRDLAGKCALTFPEDGADHTIEFSPA